MKKIYAFLQGGRTLLLNILQAPADCVKDIRLFIRSFLYEKGLIIRAKTAKNSRPNSKLRIKHALEIRNVAIKCAFILHFSDKR